ncbi:MAG: S-methyl-5-thioribose-1-phosphate isomerase [Candidatus Omnitrophica bacterium]|nr:S-methyl-5-thioribose-1-phosphate isomerase [Candidatus Omnitrophota bacterium]
MYIQTIAWKDNAIRIIDQNKLPQKLKYIYIKDISSLWKAIKIMQIRGAPALAGAAGLGLYLGIKESKAKNFGQFIKELDRLIRYLSMSRPTARNLFWALERIRKKVLKHKKNPVFELKKIIFNETQKIILEDKIACRRIGEFGARLIKDNDTILTICNTGIFATIDYGTALGIIYRAKEKGKYIKVYVCETRPMLQGARLTTWELKHKGLDVTLICDSMAAYLMQKKKINKVIVGADRVAINGDTANKIGTYNLAVLSFYHRIPFYVACPLSTFDLSCKDGGDIPIEQRSVKEVRELFFKKPIAKKNIKIFNPAFDITPHNLITAIITDKGIIKKPYKKNILRIIKNKNAIK